MPADIYSLAPINLRLAGAGADIVIPAENHAFSAEILANPFFHSGNVSPTQITVPGANPRVTVSMPFADAFSAFGLSMVKLTTLDVFLSKYADFLRLGVTSHPNINLTAGAFAGAQITDWSVGVDGILMAEVTFDMFSNDQDNPFEIGSGLTLPVVATEPVLHTLGPALLNNVVIPGLSANNGSINGQTIIQRSDGDLFPRVGARPQIQPTARLAHNDPIAVLAALGLLGTTVTATTELYFKEYSPTTGVVRSDGGAVKLAIAKGRLNPDGWQAGQGAVATTGINVIGYAADGIANPFVVTLNTVPPATP